ncbi:MAG: NUDIX hydrolase [Phycisphaerales bacterium]|nr:NUDIX hydrolase [Phycisphaerales bacterium]
MEQPGFCSSCGGRLATAATAPPGTRPACVTCGRISYLDPKLAAAAIVDLDGKLVLVRRGIEPAIGKWSFPSGYVDRGEIVEAAVEREVSEETGLRVKANWLVGLYSQSGDAVVLAVYDVTVVGGDLRAGPEVLEVGDFDPRHLPELAFAHDDGIVADWQRGRAGRR